MCGLSPKTAASLNGKYGENLAAEGRKDRLRSRGSTTTLLLSELRTSPGLPRSRAKPEKARNPRCTKYKQQCHAASAVKTRESLTGESEGLTIHCFSCNSWLHLLCFRLSTEAVQQYSCRPQTGSATDVLPSKHLCHKIVVSTPDLVPSTLLPFTPICHSAASEPMSEPSVIPSPASIFLT